MPLIEIAVSSEPPFVLPRSWRLQQVSAGQLRLVKSLDVKLDGALLAAQTEASRTLVTFVASGPGGSELGRATCDLRVLARNQWGGLSGMPDILAAFVLPNDPAIARILKAASEVLRQANQSPSLEGYQGDKKRVWAQAQAIWNAVCGLEVSYINPPASFVETGQRIRLPTQVVEERLATCLDTTVLFAACLEAVGLRPLIVLMKGHAFVGLWLSTVDAGTSVLQDLPGIRNRLKLDDLKVFETTLTTGLRKATFSTACERGEANLNLVDDDGESEFREIIDVHRARLRRILPLPSASAASANPDVPVDDAAAGQLVFETPPDLRELQEEVEAFETPADRVRRWCNRLLDLSARNRLLNLPKSDKQLIEIDCPDPEALEDILADMRAGGKGKPLRFVPSPGLMDKEGPAPPRPAPRSSRRGRGERLRPGGARSSGAADLAQGGPAPGGANRDLPAGASGRSGRRHQRPLPDDWRARLDAAGQGRSVSRAPDPRARHSPAREREVGLYAARPRRREPYQLDAAGDAADRLRDPHPVARRPDASRGRVRLGRPRHRGSLPRASAARAGLGSARARHPHHAELREVPHVEGPAGAPREPPGERCRRTPARRRLDREGGVEPQRRHLRRRGRSGRGAVGSEADLPARSGLVAATRRRGVRRRAKASS